MSISNCEIYGITTYFNSQKYINKLENYRLFRKHSKEQGLQLITVELAFNNEPFELTKNDAEILIQVRSHSVLWQKERLLNIALEKVPKGCKKIIWLDADVLFQDKTWIAKTSKLLDKYLVVQPFSYAARLPKGVRNIRADVSSYQNGPHDGQKIMGLAYKFINFQKGYSAPGFAWAAQKKIFSEIGFFDKMVLGSGDSIMSKAFFPASNFLSAINMDSYVSKKLQNSILKWQETIRTRVNNSVAFTPGTVLHLFHGHRRNRLHKFRNLHLYFNRFDPDKDIRKNKDGCWEWVSNKVFLKKWGEIYFWLRNEEASFSRDVVCTVIGLPFKISEKIFNRSKKVVRLVKKIVRV